jgi:hypothetical protein
MVKIGDKCVRIGWIRGVRNRDGSFRDDPRPKTKITGLRQSSILFPSSMETRIKHVRFSSFLQFFYDDLFAFNKFSQHERRKSGAQGLAYSVAPKLGKNNNKSIGRDHGNDHTDYTS